MKKIKVFFCFLLLISFNTFSQTISVPFNHSTRQITIPNTRILIVEIKQPLLFIGSLETIYNSLIIDLTNLKILETITDSSKLSYFGERGKDGVQIAELKTKIPLFRLDEVLDYFHIPAYNRHLRISIDNEFIDPKLFLADINLIEKIETREVTAEDIILSPFYKTDWVLGEKYLNIITRK